MASIGGSAVAEGGVGGKDGAAQRDRGEKSG